MNESGTKVCIVSGDIHEAGRIEFFGLKADESVAGQVPLLVSSPIGSPPKYPLVGKIGESFEDYFLGERSGMKIYARCAPFIQERNVKILPRKLDEAVEFNFEASALPASDPVYMASNDLALDSENDKEALGDPKGLDC